MSSTVPNAASPDPVEPTPEPGSAAPRTRREAASAWSASTPSSGWSGALIAVGVLSVVLGILVLVWPQATLLIVAILFGLQLIVTGAVRIAVTRELPSEPGWLKPVSIGLGVLSIVAGIVCLFRPGASLLVIAIFIAIGWIAEGIAALAQGFGSERTTGARVFLIVFGAVAILGGLVVAIFPGSSLVVLTRVAGIVLIVIGIVELVAAVMARRAAGSSTATPATA